MNAHLTGKGQLFGRPYNHVSMCDARRQAGSTGNNKDTCSACGLIKYKLKVTTESGSYITFAEGQLTGF